MFPSYMMSERVPVREAFLTLRAFKPLSAKVEGFQMSAQGEARCIGLGTIGHGAP